MGIHQSRPGVGRSSRRYGENSATGCASARSRQERLRGGFAPRPPARSPAWRGPLAQPATGNAELKRQLGNPDAPGNPDDLQNCDQAEMEELLLHAVSADDDWADP